jgi:hypothetical protein
MEWLWASTNFYWCGYYLAPAPSQKYTGWMGKRDLLTTMGWGLAPIYVGQQQKGRGSHLPSEDQGYLDGMDAVWLARKASFPGMSVLYLDIEGPPPFAQSMIDYYKAWVWSVFMLGYWPGVYCSSGLAAQLNAIDARPRIWVANWSQRFPFNSIDVPVQYPMPDPKDSGFSGADVWQHRGDTHIPGEHGWLHRYDLDSSNYSDPSGLFSA